MEIRSIWMTFGLAYALLATLHGAVAIALYRLLDRPADLISMILFIVSGEIAGVIAAVLMYLVSRD